jgi:hypothetical protein
VKTAVVFPTYGNVILKMTAEMVLMKVISALKRLALTSNLHVQGLVTASLNLGSAMEMMIVLINR